MKQFCQLESKNRFSTWWAYLYSLVNNMVDKEGRWILNQQTEKSKVHQLDMGKEASEENDQQSGNYTGKFW